MDGEGRVGQIVPKQALQYNNKYTKALFRRAKACEITGNLMQCLEGMTLQVNLYI